MRRSVALFLATAVAALISLGGNQIIASQQESTLNPAFTEFARPELLPEAGNFMLREHDGTVSCSEATSQDIERLRRDPNIPVHAPLTFDLVDTWMERSVAGCQYHVMHPGGRNSERYPVNSFEAESRRLARFSCLAHTPGRVIVSEAHRSREFPYTLDLRLT